MPPTLVAGVDSSTQSCKVTVHDLATGQVIRSGRAPHPAGTEVDPASWWAALQEAIVDAGGLDDVSALSVAAQQHGLVALDARGEVVRDALLWNDVRSAGAAADLVAEVGAEEFARRVGVVPVASFTAAKLRWLQEHEPANAARVAAVALPHDWLSWRLRGYGPAGDSVRGPDLDALATDRSDASGTAYWSPATGAYDLDLLARAFGSVPVVPWVLAPMSGWGPRPPVSSSEPASATTPVARSASGPLPATRCYRSAPAARSSPSPNRRSATRAASWRASPTAAGTICLSSPH